MKDYYMYQHRQKRNNFGDKKAYFTSSENFHQTGTLDEFMRIRED